jgi:hypothetical protein
MQTATATTTATAPATLASTRKDDLARKVTAFDDYASLAAACKSGYVPTLQTRGGRSASAKIFDAHVRELRMALVLDGYSFWGGYSDRAAPARF